MEAPVFEKKYLVLLLLLAQGCKVPAPVSSKANGATGGTIKLSWAAPTSGQPTYYLIDQSTDGVNFMQVQQVSGAVSTANVIDLTSGKTYYFKIRASNSAGMSAFSSVVSAASQ